MSGLAMGGAAAGLAAGVLSGVFGIGGGIVLVPLLALLPGLRQHQAQGVALAVLLLPVGLPAVLAYLRRVSIRWRLVAALVAGFAVGVGGGAAAANRIPEHPLRIFFVLFLVAMAALGWRESGEAGSAARRARPRAGDWNGLWVGAAGGVLAGLLGTGGGILMVPLLVGAVGLDQREAQATTLAAMLPPIGLPGVLVYWHEQGGVRWPLVAEVAVGFAVGALLGGWLAVRPGAFRLGRAFSVFVLCVAAALAWRAFRP